MRGGLLCLSLGCAFLFFYGTRDSIELDTVALTTATTIARKQGVGCFGCKAEPGVGEPFNFGCASVWDQPPLGWAAKTAFNAVQKALFFVGQATSWVGEKQKSMGTGTDQKMGSDYSLLDIICFHKGFIGGTPFSPCHEKTGMFGGAFDEKDDDDTGAAQGQPRIAQGRAPPQAPPHGQSDPPTQRQSDPQTQGQSAPQTQGQRAQQTQGQRDQPTQNPPPLPPPLQAGQRAQQEREYTERQLEAAAQPLPPPVSTKSSSPISKLNEPKKTMLVFKSQMQGSDTPNGHCDFMDPFGEGYRGKANVAGDGNPCLPWPKKWVVEYHGSGLVLDHAACKEIQGDTLCWEACLKEQEVSSAVDLSEPCLAASHNGFGPVVYVMLLCVSRWAPLMLHSVLCSLLSFPVMGPLSLLDRTQTNNFCRNPNDAKAPFCR